MGDAPRRRSTWRITATIGATFVACFLVFWLWSHVTANRKYAELRQKVALRVAEIESRDTRRPVLLGPAEPGFAWEDYRIALQDFEKVPAPERLLTLTGPNPSGDLGWGRRLLAEHGAILDRLHRGACRDHVGRSFSWERYGQAGYSPPGLSRHWPRLQFFSEWKARQLLEEGKPREAVAVLLDVCQWGRDIASEGDIEPAGLGRVNGALHVLREFVISDRLDAPSLEDLTTALARLDSAYPPPEHAVDASVLSWEAQMRPDCEEGFGWLRLIAISTVDRPWQWGELIARSQQRPWSEVQTLIADLEQEAREGKHPVFRRSGIGVLSDGRFNREIRSQLRLVRIAAQWKASGEILDLEDPFGSRLQHTIKGDLLKVWSVGIRGSNDGRSSNENYGIEVKR
jgi:hypothetical protein